MGKCHPKCKVCHLFDHDLAWHCIECQPGYALWVDGCFEPCPAGHFRNGYGCEKCTTNCDECNGPHPHECSKCASGYNFDFRNLCVRKCKKKWFADFATNECLPCHTFCGTCLERYMTSCTSCFDGYKLRIQKPRAKTGQCMQLCPGGFFRASSDSLRCIQCSEGCAACMSIYNCTECQANYFLRYGYCYPYPAAEYTGITFDQFLQSGPDPVNMSGAPAWA